MRLPNITALQALVTLARAGSVTATAETLSVTQSAISHQLKGLEAQLGFPLLLRDGRGVRLTERAQHYVSEVAPALETVARASQRDSVGGSLVVNVAPGFASSWLAPRLGSFVAQHPGLALRVNTPRGYGDLGGRRDDLYISFLTEDEAPPGAVKLMEVSFFPVAAPSLVGGQRLSPDGLARLPLLHLDTRTDWQRWFAAGKAATPDTPGIVFQDLQIMEMAAREGQGVSLGDRLTSQRALERGALMQVSEIEVAAPRAYWLVAGNGPESDARRAFSAWMLEAI
ncbi:LysR family glycine cleavage system transcriptional activator [Litoreibacter ponti]|uniref:LysR family glycine cleavage system transcriptional activator n=1 Tax=Litoreibacter ponti TaxID=1510457 RepID=A0A2T6BN48_9RHOB|nr:LysR substrate-binding domain-containing protein [Litoreibacter ponti]PTX57499.1 LysR family glycine cleavage system transcriptional activator [Litoreibacter ponti]